ncbi:MAG TPA: endonuclease/exonuclease/phosphatase family protein [Luteitalea sp.]|nr:endonuclease/exonuclease/phosphatase family protein [Luteitalea sp.]
MRTGVTADKSQERPALAVAARALAAVPLALTLLPLSRTGQGWVRIWDFPRLQILGLGLIAQAAMLRWGTSRPADRALSTALAGALAYQAARIAPYTPLYPRQVPDAGDAPAECSIRLFMANVLQDNRRSDLVLQSIRDADPDFVCLVETDDWWVNELGPLEQDYPWTMKHPLSNDYGMFLCSRLPVTSCDVRFVVSEDVPSIRTVVTLHSGDEIVIYAVHPPPPLPESPSYGRDAELVLTGIEIAKENRAAIVVGDLNDVAWSYTARLFQRLSHMVDPRVGRGLFSTFHSEHWIARYPLDHVFHTRHFALKQLRVLPYTGSDHFPIVADLAYAPERKAEVPKPTPTSDDVENAKEMVEDAREAKPYVGADGKGRVENTPS